MKLDHLASNSRFWPTHLDESTKIGEKMAALKAQVKQIYDGFSESDRLAGKKVCITAMGVGPSFMDFVHYCDDGELASMVHIVGFSGTGRLPVSAARTYVKGKPYEATHLVVANTFANPRDISEAVGAEAKLAHAAGYTDADVIACLKEMLAAMSNTSLANQYRGTRYIPDANRLGITAPDSASVGEQLLKNGILELVKSRLNPADITCVGDNTPFVIKYGADGSKVVESHIVMSFIGPGRLTNSPLIKDAVAQGMIALATDPESKAEVVSVKACRETTKGVFCLGAMSFTCEVEGQMERKAGAGTCIEHAKLAAKELAPAIMEMAKSKSKRHALWPNSPACRSVHVDESRDSKSGQAGVRVHMGDEPPPGGVRRTGLR